MQRRRTPEGSRVLVTESRTNAAGEERNPTMQTFDEYQATMPMPIGPKLDNPHFTGDV